MVTTTPTALEVVDGVDLTGKICVVTGASGGLGRESARALAKTGAHVILAARNRRPLADTEAWIRAEVPNAVTSTVELDLTSLAAVRSAADAISAAAPAIHVLMNNAGVMFTPFGRTNDGFEMQFGTNHLGHFELMRLLAPRLAAAGVRAKVDVRRDFTMPEHGAATQVWAAVSDDLAGTGSVYLADCRIQDDQEDLAPYAMDEAHAQQLWDVSERLCAVANAGH